MSQKSLQTACDVVCTLTSRTRSDEKNVAMNGGAKMNWSAANRKIAPVSEPGIVANRGILQNAIVDGKHCLISVEGFYRQKKSA